MAISRGNKAMRSGSDRILIVAGLFSVCALLSSLGGGLLGLLCFVPAVIAIEASAGKTEQSDTIEQ